jgi:hypothetical protein
MSRVSAVAIAMLVAVTAGRAQAQAAATTPKHEFGADLYAAVLKPDGGDTRYMLILAPDVRIGFVRRTGLQYELRLSGNFLGGGGSTSYSIQPGLNLLWPWGPRSGWQNMMGRYLTAGGEVDIFGEDGAVRPALNIGVGMRQGRNAASAMRYEGFLKYVFEAESDCCIFASNLQVGARVGMSLWN